METRAVQELNKILDAGEYEGKKFQVLDRQLKRGDRYFAARMTGPHLLTCDHVKRAIGLVVPQESGADWFDIPECIGVEFESKTTTTTTTVLEQGAQA